MLKLTNTHGNNLSHHHDTQQKTIEKCDKNLLNKLIMVLCFKILTYSKIFIKNRGKLNEIFSQYFSKIMQFLQGLGGGKFRFTSSSIAMYDIIDYFMAIWMRMMMMI